MEPYEPVNITEGEQNRTFEKEVKFRKSKGRTQKFIFGIFVSSVILLVLLYLVYNQLKKLYEKELPVQVSTPLLNDDRVLLPSNQTSINDTMLYSKDLGKFQNIPVTQSLIIFIMLFSGRYFESSDNTQEYYEDKKTQIYLKKGGYSSNRKTDTSEIADLYAQYDGSNDTKVIKIHEDGLYNVYACVQLSCHMGAANEKDVRIIHEVSLDTGETTNIVARKTIKLCKGKTTYSTSNMFIPLRLQQYDKLSMRLSNNYYLYRTMKGNFMGASRL